MATNKNINKGKTSLPNQNNISSTIKSQIADFTDVVDVVVKAINTKGVIYNDKTISDVKIYSSVVKAMFDSNGVIISLANAANVIAPISNTTINIKNVKSYINGIIDLNTYLISKVVELNMINNQLSKKSDISSGIISVLKNINSIYNQILKTININNDINIGSIKTSLNQIINLLKNISSFNIDESYIENSNKNLDLIIIAYSNICSKIISLIASIEKIGDVKKAKKSLNTIKRLFKNIISLIDFISTKLAGVSDIVSNLNLKILETTYATVIYTLDKISNTLKTFKINMFLPIKLLLIRVQFLFIKRFIDNISNDNNEIISSAKHCLSTFAKFKTIETILTSMSTFFTSIYNIKINLALLRFKLRRTKSAFKTILKFIKKIDKVLVPIDTIVKFSITVLALKLVFNSLADIIATVRTVKVGLKFIWKINIMKLAVSAIIKFVKKLSILSNGKNTVNKNILISILNLTVVIHLLTHLFRIVRGTKVGLFVQFKLLMLRLCINSLINIIFAINKLKFDKRQIVKLILINNFINKLTKIFINLSISLPAILISLLAMTIMKICINLLNSVLIIAKTLKFDKKQLLKINNIKRFIKKLLEVFTLISLSIPMLIISVTSLIVFYAGSILLFGTLLGIATVINAINPVLKVGMRSLNNINKFIFKMSLSMILLSLASIIAIPAFIPIILFMGMFVIVTGLVTGIGYLITLASPILLPAIAGLGILTLMIVAIGVVALVLKGIEMLKLDGEKIKENIEIVLSTSTMIIDTIFNRNYNTKENGSKQSWLSSIISFVGGSLGTILKSITSFAFLTVTIGSICMIMLIAMQLRLIQMLNLDSDKIKQNVDLVINTALNIISSIFDKKDNKPEQSNKTWIPDVIKNFGSGLSNIINGIMSVGFLATALVSIQLVLIVAAQLRLLQTLDLNDAKIRQNVDITIDTVLYVISTLFDRNDVNSNSTNKSWIGDLLNFVGGPIVKIAQAIMAISFLATSIASIALIKVLAGQLKTISDINLPDNISDKVQSITIAANQVTEALYNRKDTATGETNEKKKGFLKSILSGLGSAVDMIASLPWLSTAMVSVGMVSKLAEQLTTINNIPDVSNITSKTEAVCNAADNLIKHLTTRPETGGDIENNSRIDIIDRINMSIQSVGDIKPKQLKTINSVFDDYSKFIDKVNTVDVTKLETSANMFAQMARFSNSIQGDFKQLAETLNEHLMPVLQELKEIMSEIPDKLDTGFQNTSASIAATTVAPTTETVTAQVNRENPAMTKKEVDTIVQQRMKDYSKTEATGVTAKLDQLIDLLKGYSGENVMVKTV